MFSGICAVLPPEVVRRCHGVSLKEKDQITRLRKCAKWDVACATF